MNILFFLLLNIILSNNLGYLVIINKPIKTYLNTVEEKINNSHMPLELKEGLDLKFEEDTKGQVYLNNNAIVNIAPHSQVSFEQIGGSRVSIKLRYGSIYYIGNTSVELESRGIKALVSGGDFVFRYNRSKLNGVFFNLNASSMKVYHSWDNKTYDIKAMNAFTLFSYASTRNLNNVNNKMVSELKSHFLIEYVPGGKTILAENLINIDLSKNSLPDMKGNIDYIRRLVNIF